MLHYSQFKAAATHFVKILLKDNDRLLPWYYCVVVVTTARIVVSAASAAFPQIRHYYNK